MPGTPGTLSLLSPASDCTSITLFGSTPNLFFTSSSEINYDPLKQRKILVNKKEMYKIINASKKEGMSIIPLLFYFNSKGIAKLTIGIGKGKKKYDKRASIKAKEWNINKQRLEKNKKYT